MGLWDGKSVQTPCNGWQRSTGCDAFQGKTIPRSKNVLLVVGPGEGLLQLYFVLGVRVGVGDNALRRVSNGNDCRWIKKYK